MARTARRVRFVLRHEILETRTLLSATDLGMWPLRNPAPVDSVLVRFRDDAPAQATQAALNALGAYQARSFPGGPAVLVLGEGTGTEGALKLLRASSWVISADPESTVQLQMIPNDPQFTSEWGLDQANDVDIDGPQAWDVTTGNSSTLVAVTDSGIDYTHPDLYLNV